MSAIASTGFRVNPDWFTIKDGIGVLKKEHRAEFIESLAESRQQSKAQFMADSTKVTLTEAQKKELAEKYDPENMTQEQFNNFIDDLCKHGVLKEQEKGYLGENYTGHTGLSLTRLEDSEVGVFVTPIRNELGYANFSFSRSGGNVLRWVNFEAGEKVFNELSGTLEKSRNAVIYGKIEDALMQMSAVEKDSKG